MGWEPEEQETRVPRGLQLLNRTRCLRRSGFLGDIAAAAWDAEDLNYLHFFPVGGFLVFSQGCLMGIVPKLRNLSGILGFRLADNSSF